MTKRRKLFQYAQTSAAPTPPALAAPAPSSTRPRPGPGPRGQLSSHPVERGQLSQHPVSQGQLTPGSVPGSSVHPGGEVPFSPDNPQMRLLYPEYFGTPGSIVNSPHCYLPNADPQAMPMVDRGAPTSSYEKAVRLGFQPQPRQWGKLVRGDAGMGQTAFRRVQLFAQLAAVGGNVADIPFTRAIPIATQTSSDTRLRNWHVSVFGVGVTSSVGVARGPLAANTILQNGGFWGNFGLGLSGTASTTPYVPQITSFKARAMIHDESGQRYFDFDVIGSRSFDIAAYSVTIFVLVPDTGFEVDAQNPSATTATGILQDALVGARVVTAPFEPLAREIQQTQTISMAVGGAVGRMPIPPGARSVQIYAQSAAAAADIAYDITFEAVSVTDVDPSLANINMGSIILNAATFRSEVIDVPNAQSIAWRASGGANANSFIATFTVDP